MITVTQAEAYQDLANAIIVQAVKDYIQGSRRQECRKFFESQWYKELTGIPSDVIIKECDRRVRENRLRINHPKRTRGKLDD